MVLNVLIFEREENWSTHVKIPQLVASVQLDKAVNKMCSLALLVPSCQQVVSNSLTTCNKLQKDIRRVTIYLF